MATSPTSELTSPIFNLELEKAVLGAIVIEGLDVTELALSEDDFLKADHRNLYAKVKELSLAQKPIDAMILKAGGVASALLIDIAHHASMSAYVKTHIAELKALSFRRRLRRVAQDISLIADEAKDATKAQIIDKSLSLVSALSDGQGSEDEITGRQLVEIFEEAQAARQSGQIMSVSTGFSDLDDITHGFKGGQLVIVAGRPKMGKTILVCNLALSALAQGRAVLFASFELRADELADRFISMLSGVALKKLESGYLDDATTKAKEQLYHDRLAVICGKSFDIYEFKARVRQIKQRYERQDQELGLIVVDLLTHLKAPGKERRELEVAMISRELKILSQEVDVPVVGVSQLNRAVEFRNNPRPKISDLRESGSLEQDADKILLLYRPEYYLTQKPESERTAEENERLKKVGGKCELNVAAQRQGSNGVVYLQFDGKCTRFRPLSKTQQVAQAFDADIIVDEA